MVAGPSGHLFSQQSTTIFCIAGNSPQFFILNITVGISPVIPLPVPQDSRILMSIPPCHPETKQLPRAVATRTFPLPCCPLMPLNPMSVYENVILRLCWEWRRLRLKVGDALVKIIRTVYQPNLPSLSSLDCHFQMETIPLLVYFPPCIKMYLKCQVCCIRLGLKGASAQWYMCVGGIKYVLSYLWHDKSFLQVQS